MSSKRKNGSVRYLLYRIPQQFNKLLYSQFLILNLAAGLLKYNPHYSVLVRTNLHTVLKKKNTKWSYIPLSCSLRGGRKANRVGSAAGGLPDAACKPAHH
ncbi:MAG: hypothetical protein ABSF90_12870 [Syntrophobacteraceae bacterium]